MTAGPATVVTNVAPPLSVRATGPVRNAAITTSHGASSAIAVKPPRPAVPAVAVAAVEATSAEMTEAEIAEVEADIRVETTEAEIAEVEAVEADTSVAKAAVAEVTSAETTEAEIAEVAAVAEATSAETTKAEIAEAVTTKVAKAVIEGPRAAIVVRNPVIQANPATGVPRVARTPTRVTPSERAEI